MLLPSSSFCLTELQLLLFICHIYSKCSRRFCQKSPEGKLYLQKPLHPKCDLFRRVASTLNQPRDKPQTGCVDPLVHSYLIGTLLLIILCRLDFLEPKNSHNPFNNNQNVP